MLRRTLAALAHAALLPVRGATQLVEQGWAQQHFFLPVLNGALGDQLAAHHDPRAIQLSFRHEGRDISVAELALEGPHRQTVVFVHGLMGDEQPWQAGAAPTPPPSSLRYGPRLAAEAGVRPLYVRYNSGLHISENGRALHQLLAELVAAYPEAVGELVLVGHSMGGLVIRSAGYYGGTDKYQGASIKHQSPDNKEDASKKSILGNDSWLARLRAVFLLGVPNDGSYLEQNSAAVERLLRRIDLLPTRFLSNAFAQRSSGIKDLGDARLVDADWQLPPTTPPRPRTAVPLLPGVAYHVLVGALLPAGRAQALRDYFGDGLVGTASGQGRDLAPEAALPPGTTLRTVHFTSRHHAGLLHDEGVYQYLRQWVG